MTDGLGLFVGLPFAELMDSPKLDAITAEVWRTVELHLKADYPRIIGRLTADAEWHWVATAALRNYIAACHQPKAESWERPKNLKDRVESLATKAAAAAELAARMDAAYRGFQSDGVNLMASSVSDSLHAANEAIKDAVLQLNRIITAEDEARAHDTAPRDILTRFACDFAFAWVSAGLELSGDTTGDRFDGVLRAIAITVEQDGKSIEARITAAAKAAREGVSFLVKK